VPRISVSRAATPQECEQAMAVWRAGNRTGRRPAGEARAARVLDRLRNAEVLLLARYGDDAAGMLMAEQFVRDPGAIVEPDIGHIAMVTVHPSRWGSGIGSALLAALQDGSGVASWTRLSAWVRADNRRGLRLFAGAGFADTGNRAHLQDGDVIHQLTWSRPA
jgi:ribosomal protein S18 acetylase RimI-like enzyme